MAEEGTLGLVRAQEKPAENLSKEDLQQRLDETRQSISETVTEIKETVQHQVQAVKDTLDWREQVKRRPVAWSAGALGVGFAVGYCLAANVLDPDETTSYEHEGRSYAAQPVIGLHHKTEESGPGIIERVTNTPAYGRVKQEVGAIGNVFVDEIGKVAKTVIVPALIASIRDFVGGHLPAGQEARGKAVRDASNYQPKLEHNQ
jgi:hypothetical protein